MGERRGVCRVLMGKLEERERDRDHFEDPYLDGRIILKWIFRKWVRETWTGLMWHRSGTGGGHL